ncbi:MAG TPA: helix-turn-helix domain-containing protein [Nitrososphaera sp.]
MLNLQAAAKLLGVSYATIRRLIENGILPAINATPYSSQKNYRIKKDDLEQYMNNNGLNGFTAVNE